MAGKAGVLREKTLQAVIYFYFILLSIFCYWTIALLNCLFTQRTHMLTSYSIKWMGLRKATPQAIPHRVGDGHEFSGTQDSDTERSRLCV